MAVSGVYVLHGIQTANGLISQISSATVSPGIRTMVVRAAGVPSPLGVLNLKQDPGIAFTSTQVKSLLDLTGVTIADLSADNTDLYFRAAVDGGSRVATTAESNIRLRAAQACLDLSSITAGDESPASASCRLICYYDGTNEPIVPAGSVALAGASTAAEQYVSGPVFLNTGSGLAQLSGVKEITIDFGRTLIAEGADGELYITFVAVGEETPVITIRGLNVPWTTIGLNGASLTAGSFYLRKMATTGRVANATAQHIKFSCGNAYAYISESGGGDNTPITTTLTIMPSEDDPDAFALAVNTAIAITT